MKLLTDEQVKQCQFLRFIDGGWTAWCIRRRKMCDAFYHDRQYRGAYNCDDFSTRAKGCKYYWDGHCSLKPIGKDNYCYLLGMFPDCPEYTDKNRYD